MPEPTAAEVHADPDGARLVHEDVDVVVAAADRAELAARLGPQRLAVRGGHGVPGVVREERVVHGGIVGAVLPADAEAHRRRDLVGDRHERALLLLLVGTEVREGEVRADRGVAAGDVEADTDDRDEVAIGRDAADRHDVAHVTVRHEGGIHRLLAHLFELEEGLLLVLTEDLHV